VLFDERNKVSRGVTRQRRFAEVRIGRQEVFRAAMQVGEITTAAAGDKDFLADAIGAFQHGNAAAALSRFDGAHQPGCAAAQHDYVKRFLVQVTSFRRRVAGCQRLEGGCAPALKTGRIEAFGVAG
jgi:hypothetical protein